jgi:hypothetical protein
MAEINHPDFRNFFAPRRFKYLEALETLLKVPNRGNRREGSWR